nr:MAG TPA: hypothetical protein [Caudoviricetes sp.]
MITLENFSSGMTNVSAATRILMRKLHMTICHTRNFQDISESALKRGLKSLMLLINY